MVEGGQRANPITKTGIRLKCPKCGEGRVEKSAKDCIFKNGMCPRCFHYFKYGTRAGGRTRD